MNILIELAKMIDHSLLHPTMTDADLQKGCEIASRYRVASVCIKPYAVASAVEWLQDSEVLVGTVVGFPHGNSSVGVKVAETLQACRDGAREVDMVVNIGKVLQHDWAYVREEITTLTQAAHANGAIIKVIFENDYLPDDSPKIQLCEICSEAEVDFVKTSTGYGFVKGDDSRYSYLGATEHDLKLMRHHSAASVQVKAAGGVRTLDDLLKVREWGATRVGATATETILNEAKQRYTNDYTEGSTTDSSTADY
jgi:deoxyribose-phosphate aldolase